MRFGSEETNDGHSLARPPFSSEKLSAAGQRKVAHALSAAKSEAHKDGASPGVGKA